MEKQATTRLDQRFDKHAEKTDTQVSPQTELLRMRATVSGMVQGVGFRYFTVLAAHRLNITGWVRNLHNGNVQVEAQGSQQALFSLYEKRVCKI